MMDTFKARLRFYMVGKKFNPTSLAKKAGLSRTAVRDLLAHNGDPNPRIDTFVKLCRALSVPPHQLSPALAELYAHLPPDFSAGTAGGEDMGKEA